MVTSHWAAVFVCHHARMRRWLKRFLGVGLLAGFAYAIWRVLDERSRASELTWTAQPFPSPPKPDVKCWRGAAAPFVEDAPLGVPASPYGASKRGAEIAGLTFHQLFAVPFVSLRFFNVYGPRLRPELALAVFTRSILEGTPLPLYGDGSVLRDFTHVSDICRGIFAALTAPGVAGQCINLGHDQPIAIRRLIELIEEAAGLGKHRKRRRRAQLKLERTQDNLDRALDVEREARSRLRPLKAQAESAERQAKLAKQENELRAQLVSSDLRSHEDLLRSAESSPASVVPRSSKSRWNRAVIRANSGSVVRNSSMSARVSALTSPAKYAGSRS